MPNKDEDDQGFFEWLLSKGVHPDHAQVVHKPEGQNFFEKTLANPPPAVDDGPGYFEKLMAQVPAQPQPAAQPTWNGQPVASVPVSRGKEWQNTEWDTRYGGGAESVEDRPHSKTYHYPFGVPYSELTVGDNGQIIVVPREGDTRVGPAVRPRIDPELLKYAMSR